MFFVKEILAPKELYGVDISEDAIEKAKKKGIKAFTINVGEEKLPFKDNFFDVVITFEVIEHVFDTGAFIKEIKRVMKQDGTLFLSTPNLAWWFNKVLLFLGYQPANTEVDLEHSTIGKPKLLQSGIPAGHIHVFTTRSMQEFLHLHHLNVKKRIPIRYEHIYTSSIAKNILLRCFYLCDCASFLFCYRTAFTTQHIFPDRCQNGSCMTASRNNTSRRYGRFGTSRSRQEFPCRILYRKTTPFPVRCEIRTL